MSLQKGQRGERELARMLSERLNAEIKRKLGQARESGADILDVPGLVIEVKRHEALAVRSWWNQVLRAERELRAVDGVRRIPVLAYRQNRRSWQFCLPEALLGVSGDGYVTLHADTFLEWLEVFVDE